MYNSKTKIYPDGSTNTIYCNYRKFHDKEEIQAVFETSEKTDIVTDVPTDKEEKKQIKRSTIMCGTKGSCTEVRDDNIKRAKDKIQDIALLNDFQYFATLTFNPQKVDSYDVQAVIKAIRNWFADGVKRRGYKYIAIPEYHKSGRIHIHALISGDLKLADSGKVRNGKQVLNITDWNNRFGFADVVKIDGNYTRLTYYITKYIIKGNDKIFGRFYWSSKNLNRTPETTYENVDFDEIHSEEYSISGSFIKYKYKANFKFWSENNG